MPLIHDGVHGHGGPMKDALDTHTVSGPSCARVILRDGRDIAYDVEPVPFLRVLRRQRLKPQLHVYLRDDIVCTPSGIFESQSRSSELVRGNAATLSDTRPGTEPEKREVRTIPRTEPCPQSTGWGDRRGSIAWTAPVRLTLHPGAQVSLLNHHK